MLLEKIIGSEFHPLLQPLIYLGEPLIIVVILKLLFEKLIDICYPNQNSSQKFTYDNEYNSEPEKKEKKRDYTGYDEAGQLSIWSQMTCDNCKYYSNCYCDKHNRFTDQYHTCNSYTKK